MTPDPPDPSGPPDPPDPSGPLVHLVARADWEAAAAGTHYEPPDLDQVGFIHLSTPEQVAIPANRFYAGRRDLVLLVIDPRAVAAEIRWEAGVPPEGDLRFPHLYGPLEVSAVRAVVDFAPSSESGRFEAPPSESISSG